jgi:uncharacterized membrane protein
LAQTNSIGRALLFGAVTGMRSMLGSALISRHLAKQHGWGGSEGPKSLLASSGAANLLTVLASGELIADKLPGIPARTAPGPLVVRGLFGALAGTAACSGRRDNAAAGALVGAGAAIAAAFGAYYLRKWLTEEVGLPDAIVAVAEDAVALSIGQSATAL